MKGETLLDAKVVVSEVEVEVDVDVHVMTKRELKEGCESFPVNDPSMLSCDTYQLELADGRAGHIQITRKSIVSGARTSFIQCTGTGALSPEGEG